jgi:hypothetical protein
MTNFKQVRQLDDHLWARSREAEGSIAYGIVTDPKAHMDALVEAGVVMMAEPHSSMFGYYRLPKPHVHEPYGIAFDEVKKRVFVGCRRCKAEYILPIEWPNDE